MSTCYPTDKNKTLRWKVTVETFVSKCWIRIEMIQLIIELSTSVFQKYPFVSFACQCRCHNCRNLCTFFWMKFGLKVLLRVKRLTFCHSEQCIVWSKWQTAVCQCYDVRCGISLLVNVNICAHWGVINHGGWRSLLFRRLACKFWPCR